MKSNKYHIERRNIFLNDFFLNINLSEIDSLRKNTVKLTSMLRMLALLLKHQWVNSPTFKSNKFF